MLRSEFLVKRVKELEDEHATSLRLIEEVKVKLDETDEKRQAEKSEVGRMKFNKMLDNLEARLDVLKARVVKCEVELNEKRRALKEVLEKTPPAEAGDQNPAEPTPPEA